MSLEVGQVAPNFTLKDQAGNDVSLSDYCGVQPVVIVFIPFPFSGICQDELCQIRDDPSTFENAGAAVIAISCATRHSHDVWAEREGFSFPVLSDFWPHGATTQAYGVFNEVVGCANRASFIVDIEGKIAASFATTTLSTAREHDEYGKALANL